MPLLQLNPLPLLLRIKSSIKVLFLQENNGKNFKGNVGKGRPMYSYCGKVGHIKEKCYRLVGFPPGYKQKGKFPMANQVMMDCDQAQNEAVHQNNNFSFTPEQY